MVFSNNLLMGAAGQATGYEIDQSIRFDNVDGVNAGGAQMYRLALTGTPTNTKKATISAWVKRATLGYYQVIAYAGDPNGSTAETLRFNNDDTLNFAQASSDYVLTTTQVFRDVGAWYHIVAEIDTANGTSADRANLYVNGTKVTSLSTENYPTEDYVTNWTATSGSIAHTWGANAIPAVGPSSQLFAGYMAEMFVLDGEKAGASSFGETNNDGVWVPIEYSGSFGNNGYYMTGETASALGEDFSGNNLDFTTVALATTDQMLDTPTDNYCVLSPIDKSSAITTSDGNLVVTNASTNSWNHGRGTLFAPSGKWYYEWIPTAGSYALAGWMLNVSGNDYVEEESDVATTFYRGVGAAGHGFVIGSGSTDSSVTNFALDDVIMMAIDVDSMKMWVGINGTWYNSGDPAGDSNPVGTWTDAIGQSVAPWYGCFNGTTESFNFGQRPFAHTIPTGFNSWNTANLPTPSITDSSAYFDTKLWTGNDTDGRAITGYNFSPDWVWIKSRSGAYSHNITDTVRGAGNFIQSNTTDVEVDGPGAFGSTLAFTSDGFTLDNGTTSNLYVNGDGVTYVGWGWEANGSGSSNEDGSINTTATSANTTAGFSISTYTGTGSAATIGHGLGIAPKMIIVKKRVVGTDDAWIVWHASLPGANYYLNLNDTGAQDTSVNYWNNTLPTSAVFSVGASNGTNENTKTFVAYCFAEIPGYSSIGSYTGNGNSSGPFVYTGFKTAFILIKSVGVEEWSMTDSTRDPTNRTTTRNLIANASTAEADPATRAIDYLSNGFKIRNTNSAHNSSGVVYTYVAFAENPFGGEDIAPATAR